MSRLSDEKFLINLLIHALILVLLSVECFLRRQFECGLYELVLRISFIIINNNLENNNYENYLVFRKRQKKKKCTEMH